MVPERLGDARPVLYVDAAVNDDAVRTYYELPEWLVQAIRLGAGGGGTADTLAFDQALAVFTKALEARNKRLLAVLKEIAESSELKGALQVWAWQAYRKETDDPT